MGPLIEIISSGVGISIQDAGRDGWRRFGVPSGGAMDLYSMRMANRLLGNREEAPVLEVVLQGTKLRVLEDTWLAVAGADLGAGIAPWTASRVTAGTVLSFTGGQAGTFTYLAMPGGVGAERWFGSASVDARNGLGEVLKKGMCVSSVLREPCFSHERVARRLIPPADCRRFTTENSSFGLLRGPQYSLFTDDSRRMLAESEWRVSSQSDRTGFRLEGPVLDVPTSILSEPVLPGSFQIPGNGQPIVTMVDGPTVGGYAKLAHLPEAERDRLAQCAPGTKIRFEWLES